MIDIQEVSKSYHISTAKQHYKALRDIFSGFIPGKKAANNASLFWALRQVSLNINDGERWGIIGRNGAGKSTLLKILSRITPPTTGKIIIEGKLSSLLEVGTGFHPELSGRENIFLNGSILGMPKADIKKKLDEIVAFAGVSEFIDVPVKKYSSGMYVRLAFAVAAHLEPDILLVDEVLAVGDAEFQKKCLGKMKEVSQNDGRTVVFVSHQMDAIERLTDKCLYLKKGKPAFVGNTSEAVQHYLAENNAQVNIEEYENRTGNGQVKLVKLQVMQHGASKSMIRQGDCFEVLVGIQNNQNEAVDVSFVLETAKEQAISCTQLSDHQPFIVQKGYVEKLIKLNIPYLRQGNYLCSLATFNKSRDTFFDVVLHFPFLTVEGVHPNTFFPSDNRWGNLFFDAVWE